MRLGFRVRGFGLRALCFTHIPSETSLSVSTSDGLANPFPSTSTHPTSNSLLILHQLTDYLSGIHTSQEP